MDRRERDVQKERGRTTRLDPADGFGGDQVGDVPRFFEQFFVAMPCLRERALLVAMIPRTDSASKRAVRMIEAKMVRPLFRQRAEMPLAGEAGVVADALQGSRQSDGVPR